VRRHTLDLARPGRELKAGLVTRRRPRLAGSLAFARPENWLVSKIPPLLAVAYLAVGRFGTAPDDVLRLLASGLVSIVCVATYGHLVNDMFDLEADRLANKVNRLAAMRPVRRVLLTGVFLIAGFLPSLFTDYSVWALSLLALNYLWPTLYSIPATRLKERGLLGVACDALGSHITPTLFVLALFASASPDRSVSGRTTFIVVATLWAGALGLKGILHHQIADRHSDLQAGIATFATRVPVEGIQRFLSRFNLLVELPISALLTAIVAQRCPAAVAAWVIYTGSEAIKYKLGFQFALTPAAAMRRASVPFANEMFYVLWMPMAAAVQLALDDPILIWIPLVQIAVFRQPVVQQIGDWRAILTNANLVRAARRARRVDASDGTGIQPVSRGARRG
jgi:hypothetical protein